MFLITLSYCWEWISPSWQYHQSSILVSLFNWYNSNHQLSFFSEIFIKIANTERWQRSKIDPIPDNYRSGTTVVMSLRIYCSLSPVKGSYSYCVTVQKWLGYALSSNSKIWGLQQNQNWNPKPQQTGSHICKLSLKWYNFESLIIDRTAM